MTPSFRLATFLAAIITATTTSFTSALATPLPVEATSVSKLIIENQLFLSRAVPDSKIDEFTDFYFYVIHPEMEGNRIQREQFLYQKEWLAIRAVVRHRIAWTKLSLCQADIGEYGYDLVGDLSELASAITDAAFYARHPNLVGRKIRVGETKLTEEWNAIFKRVKSYMVC